MSLVKRIALFIGTVAMGWLLLALEAGVGVSDFKDPVVWGFAIFLGYLVLFGESHLAKLGKYRWNGKRMNDRVK